MKLHVLSDLHTEFAPFSPPETDADALVLAGDTGVGLRGMERARGWAEALGKPVVYVAGNHEFYGGAIPRHHEKLAAAAEGTGVRFLENGLAALGGARVLGCTLWTDFNLFGNRYLDAAAAQAVMNDFRKIRVSPAFHRFRPGDARRLHQKSVEWLRARLDEPFDGPTVVVTHHAPSLRSLDPSDRSDPVSAGDASDLEWLLDGRAALWIHGHTHYRADYTAGGTRVVSNPRGYPDEPVPGFDPGLVVEVPGA